MHEGHRFELATRDISLGGSLVELQSDCRIAEGTRLEIRLEIGFAGVARVCRVVGQQFGKTLLGLQFEQTALA